MTTGVTPAARSVSTQPIWRSRATNPDPAEAGSGAQPGGSVEFMVKMPMRVCPRSRRCWAPSRAPWRSSRSTLEASATGSPSTNTSGSRRFTSQSTAG